MIASHRASAKGMPVIGHVVSHDRYLVITAPADEYFGRTKLSPIGVRNELTRIGKYLDAGWGGRMTKDTLWVVDSLDDWQHQYPRDYELPRLYKRAYDTLARVGTPEAKQAQARRPPHAAGQLPDLHRGEGLPLVVVVRRERQRKS